ncbi:hypothetical protein [Kocuria sp.]|uniref:hypothetical protein n=1 Tax=Kocuria sp. TaxID=1871328 RepID=UPI0026DF8E06|nr:hypothetical protein [Kocuria sp.]MDO5619186.1 hypothetical protein [Kocuria sp.]
MADADPQAAHDALRRPAAFTADPTGLQRNVAAAGDSAQQTLTEVVTGRGNTPADKVAAAVMLAAVFDQDSTASKITAQEAVDPSVLELTWAAEFQPAARDILGEPVIMSLLTWASSAAPGEPPVATARTAAALGIDDDGAIYQKVSQRAVQMADQRGTHRARKDQLREFTEALGRADQTARQTRGAATASGQSSTEARSLSDSGKQTQASEQPQADGEEAAASSETGHPEHASDAQPSTWSDHDDRALDNLLGRDQDPGHTEPPAEPTAQEDPQYGRPVGFHDGPTSQDASKAQDATPGWGSGSTGPKDEPRYGDRFEDQRWSDPQSADQDPPGPGPRRAYDPRALFDGPMSEAQRADEKNVLRNWGITAAVLVGILVLVGLLI